MAKKENKWFENYPLRNIKIEKEKQNKSIGNSRFFFSLTQIEKKHKLINPTIKNIKENSHNEKEQKKKRITLKACTISGDREFEQKERVRIFLRRR